MKKFSSEQGLVTPTKLYETDFIMFSEQFQADETALLEKFVGRPDIRPQFYKFGYDEIIKLTPLPDYKDPTIRIQIKPDNELDLFHLDYKTHAEYKEALDFLIQKTNLKPKEVMKSTSKSWIKNILYTIVVGIFVGLIYKSALVSEQGGQMQVSGSRKGLKQLIVTIGESLGSTFSLILWIGIVAVFAYITYNSYIKSKIKTTIYVR